MTHAVVLEIDGVAYDDRTLDGVTIQWGRQSVQDQPEPTTCSLVLLRDSTIGTVDVTNIQVGSLVKLQVTPSGQSPLRRFFGIITDVDVNYETIVVQCVATGLYTMRQLGYAVPTEGTATVLETNATVAVLSVYSGAGEQAGVDMTTNPPTGNVQFPSYGVDVSYPSGHPTVSEILIWPTGEEPDTYYVSDFMRRWADAVPSGVIFEQMLVVAGVDNVNVIFAGQLARDTTLTPNVTLSAAEVLLDWRSQRDLGLFCTSSTITYSGPESGYAYPNGGVETFTGDIPNRRGFTKDYSTKLVFAADAAELAQVNVQNGQIPGYVTQVTVPLATLAPSRQSTIITSLIPGVKFATPALATGLPTLYFLEGYTETISRADWVLNLMLSDPSNSWYGQRWQDVTATLQWGQVPAATRWVDLQGEEL